MTNIRPMHEDDIPELENLFLVTRQKTFIWEDPLTFKKEDFIKFTEGEKVFVAERSGIILGFISIHDEEKSFIHNLYIHPDYHNQGIGSKLLDKAISMFALPITLKVLIKNQAACNFYEKRGWMRVLTDEQSIQPYHLYSYG